MMQPLQGSLVALVTPMKADGSLDFDALGGLIEWQIESGTDGIVSVGTTGESATISVPEHLEIIEKTIEFNEKLGKPAEFGSKKGEILTASDLLVKDSEYYIFKDIQNYAVDYNRDLNQKVDEIKGDTTIGVEVKPIDNIEINAKGHYLIKNDNDYNKIPSKAKFVDPDSGEIRIKP